jgi:hypothetical protein
MLQMIWVSDDVIYEPDENEYTIEATALEVGPCVVESEGLMKDDATTFVTRVSAQTVHGQLAWSVETEQSYGKPTLSGVPQWSSFC